MESLSHQDHLQALQVIADTAVARYDLPSGVKASLWNLSENATSRVDDPASGRRWALRVHREGYHSHNAIASELAWLMALRDDDAVITPTPIRGRDGHLIQTVATAVFASPRYVVLFAWESGVEPGENDAAGFE